MRIPLLAAGLVVVFAIGPELHAQEAEVVGDSARAAVNTGRWADAEGWLDRLHELSPLATRDSVDFWRGLSAYRQGEAIARRNARAGATAAAILARDHFQRARDRLVGAAHPQQETLMNAVEEYILNQEEIIAARRE